MSRLPDASKPVVCEKSRVTTVSVCEDNTSTDSPVSASMMVIVLFALPDASYIALGVYAIERI